MRKKKMMSMMAMPKKKTYFPCSVVFLRFVKILSLVLPSLLLGLLVQPTDGVCSISEYYCDNRRCISLDKFCNGVNDCGDGSDEPRYCSPCNRTYYGEVGGTYSISVHRPSSRESQLPYVCQLTFAAGGNRFGDLVQLIFNSVTLGPPLSSDPHMISPTDSDSKSPICLEGHVTLTEPDRPTTAGHWCGQGWGLAVFFSETQRVTLTLSLFSIPVNPGTFAFDFRLSYKFLRRRESTVRYGPPQRPYHRGQLLGGTFCSLIFQSCDKERCALQTPNFPGIYPRNVTCFYAIRQETAPVGHRAVIKLKQDKEHLIYVRNRLAAKKSGYPLGGYSESSSGMGSGSDSSSRKSQVQDISVGEDCDTTSDHVTIYDGYTIRDPVLLRFCGGGKLPTVISSGNEMLVVFHSAPTDYLLQNFPATPVQGFHVDVEIKYLPIGSHSYVENHNCFFTISSFQQKRGFLTSPQHSLPDRTTCTYILQGSPGEIVWISLLKFYIGPQHGKSGDDIGGGSSSSSYSSSIFSSIGGTHGGGLGGMSGGAGIISNSPDCNATYLQIWQGTYGEASANATLLAHMCEDKPLKKSCEFMLSTSSKTPQRACHPEESFISTGPHMTLRLGVETSTVLRPVEFKLYYEFVETKQDGEAFLPAYLSHQTALNLFSAPNLPRPFVSSSSNLHIGKSGMNILSGAGMVGAGNTIIHTSSGISSLASTNGRRSNGRALRLTSGENANKHKDIMMMNTASSSSSALEWGSSSYIGKSRGNSFTVNRLSGPTSAMEQNDDGNIVGGNGGSGVESKGNNIIGGGAMSSLSTVGGGPGISRDTNSGSSYLISSSSGNNPNGFSTTAQVAGVAAASTARESLPITPKQSCSRIFKSQNRAIQAGSFTSPRNVFFFGRGGVRNLTCIYRFLGGPNERVRLTIDKISLDGGYCKASVEPNVGRSMCYPLSPNESATVTEGQVQLWEVPWNDSRIMKECLCNTPQPPFVMNSVTNAMDLVLEVKNMKAFHDQNHFAFEGRYEFIKQPDCPRAQKLRTASGEIILKIPEKYPHKSCEHFPWEIDPQSPSHYIFMTIPGRTMKKFQARKHHSSSKKSSVSQSSSSSSQSSSTSHQHQQQEHCSNRNRILVYTGGPNGRLLQVICPEDSSSASSHVEIFSEGWYSNSFPNFAENPHLDWAHFASSNQLIVELVSRSGGTPAEYNVKWLQISRKDEPLAVNYHYGTIPGSIGILSELSPDGITKILTPLDNGGLGKNNMVASGSGGVNNGMNGMSGATSSSSIGGTSSSITEELENDVCFKFKCPELNACISPTLFCDGIEHCPSGHDEADCEYFPIPRTYLYIAAASIIAIVVLSCCFGCLFCKRKRDERREKLLMSSRTPTEDMFYGTGSSSHREIVC
ncbi:unnamed protein product [Orchesella dallaii]|uniref:CUB domain-containing protein n=1 Tax=Orchesella dallaii TaxID=48710 RepID=A0ABP1QT14_9HEXA